MSLGEVWGAWRELRAWRGQGESGEGLEVQGWGLRESPVWDLEEQR